VDVSGSLVKSLLEYVVVLGTENVFDDVQVCVWWDVHAWAYAM